VTRLGTPSSVRSRRGVLFGCLNSTDYNGTPRKCSAGACFRMSALARTWDTAVESMLWPEELRGPPGCPCRGWMWREVILCFLHVPSTNCRYPWSMVFAGVLWLSYGYQTDRQTDSQPARQAGRQTQTDRPTGRQPRRRRGRERERERESARHVAPDRWHDARCMIPWKIMNPNNTKRSATGCHWLDTLLAIL